MLNGNNKPKRPDSEYSKNKKNNENLEYDEDVNDENDFIFSIEPATQILICTIVIMIITTICTFGKA